MTEVNTMPIVTLKAEIVTEFVFTPAYKVSRYRVNTEEIEAPYRKDFEAKVGVRVGNTVKELTFRTHTKYMDSYRDENGNWCSRDNIEYQDIDDRSAFAELEAAGIAIDYIDVLVQYQKAVEVAKYRMSLHTRYKNWERIRGLKKDYAASWIHGVKAELDADKNKRIQAALLETVFEKTTLESYLSHPSDSVRLTYKGVTGFIHREGGSDGSYYFDGESTYKFPEDWNGESSYNHRFKISDGKKRRAKRIGTLYLKFVEEVDYELTARENRANRLKSEAEKRAEKKARLSEITGYPVIILKSEKSRRDHRGHYVGSYDEYTYFILIGQPESKYSSPTGFAIDEDIKTEYKDGKNVEIGREYSIRNLRGLSKEQFKSILDILMEGKVALTKLEIPN